MCVYSNDGFTVTEALVQATPGKSYIEFVQDEILMPLGMDNTRRSSSMSLPRAEPSAPQKIWRRSP